MGVCRNQAERLRVDLDAVRDPVGPAERAVGWHGGRDHGCLDHLVAGTPVGPADMFRLLCAPGPVVRLALLAEVLDDVEAMLQFRLTTHGVGDAATDDLSD